MVGCCHIQHQKNVTLLSISEMTSDIKTVTSTWLGGNSSKLNCNCDGGKEATWWFSVSLAQGKGVGWLDGEFCPFFSSFVVLLFLIFSSALCGYSTLEREQQMYSEIRMCQKFCGVQYIMDAWDYFFWVGTFGSWFRLSWSQKNQCSPRECIEWDYIFISAFTCVYMSGTKGMVISGVPGWCPGFYHQIPVLERSLGSPDSWLVHGTAWKQRCLEMHCKFGGQNWASSTAIKDGFPKQLRLAMPGAPESPNLSGIEAPRYQRGGSSAGVGVRRSECERQEGKRAWGIAPAGQDWAPLETPHTTRAKFHLLFSWRMGSSNFVWEEAAWAGSTVFAAKLLNK